MIKKNNHKCPFKINRECPFGFNEEILKQNADLVKLYCAMCVKSLYARAKFKLVNRYSMVNTI